MTKIILFNSPPGSGKDFACEYLSQKEKVFHFEFKHSLFKITKAIYSISDDVWDEWYTREGKDIQRLELGGLSCRQALIEVSEEVIKPFYGKDWFGLSVVKQIVQLQKEYPNAIAVVSDCGFNSEVEALCEHFNVEDIWIVRIYAEGCTYDGDSRSWIDTEAVLDDHYISINNSKDEMFKTVLEDTFEYIMNN